MQQRVIILIDGSNFYHRLKELEFRDTLKFNYKLFAENLVRSRTLIFATYYIGAIRERAGDEKSKILNTSQLKLFSHLEQSGWNVVLGHMLKTDAYHEKGVDVRIATDMLVGAYEDTYDTLFVVSSDTDLIPAIEHVRSRGKRVFYVGFRHRPSFGLIHQTDHHILLTKDALTQFFPM